MTSPEKLAELVAEFCSGTDSDLLLYNAPMSNIGADQLIIKVNSIRDRQKRASLVLTTNGGNPDAAYRIARHLQKQYEELVLYVFGYCKSAGTLLALGADKIVMSDFGELGPLDMQVNKRDDLVYRSSGLDIQQALDVITSKGFAVFEEYLIGLIDDTQGAISTQTAASIASSMAVQLLSPISQQVDPLHLGEMHRVMRIGFEYGERLSTRLGTRGLTQERKDAIIKLTSDYPSHGFVLDYDEAKNLLDNVHKPGPLECKLEEFMRSSFRAEGARPIVEWLSPVQTATQIEVDDHGDDQTNERTAEEAPAGNHVQSAAPTEGFIASY
jgi:hypothetical protein